MLPLVGRVAGSLDHWLAPARGSMTLRLEPDLDRIPALSGERDALWTRLQAAIILTDAGKREAVGYGPRPGGGKEMNITVEVPLDVMDPGGGGGDGLLSGGGGGSWQDQPRVPAGHPDGGQWTTELGGAGGGDGRALPISAEQQASVIPVCVIAHAFRNADEFGNKSYKAIYDCGNGLEWTKTGLGHAFPGLIRNPYRAL